MNRKLLLAHPKLSHRIVQKHTYWVGQISINCGLLTRISHQINFQLTDSLRIRPNSVLASNLIVIKNLTFFSMFLYLGLVESCSGTQCLSIWYQTVFSVRTYGYSEKRDKVDDNLIFNVNSLIIGQHQKRHQTKKNFSQSKFLCQKWKWRFKCN